MENKEPYSGAKLCIQEKVDGDQGLFWAWDQGRMKEGPGTQKSAWSAALSSARVLPLI